MNYDKSHNDTEISSAEEDQLREICRSLKKVDAPKDFDFKLKARIASTNAGRFQPRFGFAFRYALPALLALTFVLGLLVYNGGFLSSNNPVVAESSLVPQNTVSPQNTALSNPVSPARNPNESLAVLPSNQNLPKVPASEFSLRNPKKPETEKKAKSDNRISTFSEDKTFRNIEVLTPRDFEQKVPPQNLQTIERPSPIPVKAIFSLMGINADFENGKWTVKSVTANSLGESSDVKANDIIEAIDAQPLSAETVFNRINNAKTITVTRRGEKLQLRLRNKQ
jgi:hypothetical protein